MSYTPLYIPQKNSTLKKTKQQKLKELYDLIFITARRLGTNEKMDRLDYAIMELAMTPEEKIQDVDKFVHDLMMSCVSVVRVNINDF